MNEDLASVENDGITASAQVIFFRQFYYQNGQYGCRIDGYRVVKIERRLKVEVSDDGTIWKQPTAEKETSVLLECVDCLMLKPGDRVMAYGPRGCAQTADFVESLPDGKYKIVVDTTPEIVPAVMSLEYWVQKRVDEEKRKN